MDKYYLDLYALRKYFNAGGWLLTLLDQSTLFGGRSFNNTLKTGIDYYVSEKTTLGISVTGVAVNRKGYANADATWKNANGIVDAAIGTYRASNLGLSVTVQVSPFKWWSLTGEALYNHKQMKGYAEKDFSSSIDQLYININNQFRIGKTYTAEVSGYCTTRARNDLQELLYPTGQLSAGIARPVLKKKATLKLSIRDIFFTQKMEGVTQFQSTEEYFVIRRESRVVNVDFTWPFGKAFKQIKRNGGGAAGEMERVGNGNG